MSREEDLKLAHELLCGAVRFGKKNKFFDLIEGIEYLPSNSEAIARAALARILVSGDVPDSILKALAGLFDRDAGARMERKLVFKNVNQGHSKELQHFQIAMQIHALRSGGHSYRSAVKAITDQLGRDERTVRRLYEKNKAKC